MKPQQLGGSTTAELSNPFVKSRVYRRPKPDVRFHLLHVAIPEIGPIHCADTHGCTCVYSWLMVIILSLIDSSVNLQQNDC